MLKALIIGAVLIAGAAGVSTARADGTITATVRPCSLSGGPLANNKPLSVGRYAVVVKDSSKRRYFAIAGPGLRRSTTLAFVGTRTWHVKLAKGTYRYSCGAARLLRGSIVVR